MFFLHDYSFTSDGGTLKKVLSFYEKSLEKMYENWDSYQICLGVIIKTILLKKGISAGIADDWSSILKRIRQ